MITYKPIKYSKALATLLCLVMLCATSPVAFAQGNASRRTPSSTRFWSKQKLLNAGFKFGVQPSYNEVIYGKKVNGKLNGISWLRSNHSIYVGYMVDGEMAAPYFGVYLSESSNYISVQENNSSYASFRRDPMSFVVDEIYGINSSSAALRERLRSGNYNINRIITSFDDFISSGQKIPKNAWVDYVDYISGVNLKNSFPEERIPKFSNELSYPQIVNCDGVYRTESYDEGGFYISLPSKFDLRQFTLSLDFKPTGNNRTGILFSLSRRLELFIKDGYIIVESEYFNHLIWDTHCPVKMNEWNHISITYDVETLFISINNCSKFAAYVIPREVPRGNYLTSYNFSIGDNFIGLVKNIKITYQ